MDHIGALRGTSIFTARLLAVAFAALFLLTASAVSAKPFVPLPAQAGQRSGLQIRFVHYTGGANGKMVVEVRNPMQHKVTFDPKGVFFVPDGAAAQAPQRLGAAGPFEMQSGNQWSTRSQAEILPRTTVRLKLQVFCLDSHRSSPGDKQGFQVARKRLPPVLQRKIQRGTAAALTRAKHPEAAKSAIQTHIWSTRDADWVKLEGERVGEQASKHKPHTRPRHQEQQLRNPIQQRRPVR